MINEIQLKKVLSIIKDNNYKIKKEENIFELAYSMLRHIGSTDPILRDNLIYSSFYTWIERDYFSHKQLKEIMCLASNKEHLFYKIDTEEINTVFKRSFSVLIIALVLSKNIKNEFLSEKEIENIYNLLMKYMVSEKDFRGHVEQFGWADSRAHLADTLSELVKSHFIKKNSLKNILEQIKYITSICTMGTVSNEGERFNLVMKNIFEREILTLTEIANWIKSYSDIKIELEYPIAINMKMNIKSFLYPMYLEANENSKLKDLIDPIESILTKI